MVEPLEHVRIELAEDHRAPVHGVLRI